MRSTSVADRRCGHLKISAEDQADETVDDPIDEPIDETVRKNADEPVDGSANKPAPSSELVFADALCSEKVKRILKKVLPNRH